MSEDMNFRTIKNKSEELKTTSDRIYNLLKKIIEEQSSYASDEAQNLDQTETSLLRSNKLKTMTVSVAQVAMDAYLDARNELKKAEAGFLLTKGDSYLREEGFTKITEEMRKAAVMWSPELNALREVVSRLETLNRMAEALMWSVKEDEITFRELTKYKYQKQLMG